MASLPSFPVPSGLKPIPNIDTHSDTEILATLKTYQPVTSQKNVWAYWHSGLDTVRPWSQRNVFNWARRLGPEWTVRVLDDVPGSPNHLLKFVPSSYFPDAFNKKTMVGPPQHASDLLRLPLLDIHGGVWMDVGMVLLRHLDDICWRAIEDPKTPYEMAGILMPLRPQEGTMLNGFLATQKGNGLIKRWHDVYCKMWEGVTSAEGFNKHPLLAHLPPLAPQLDQLGCPPLLLPADGLGDYLAHFIAFERLRRLEDPSDGFSGAEYFAKKIFLLRAVDDLYYAQKITGWDGRKQYNMLATRVDPAAEGYSAAKQFVDNILADSVMMKLSHGPPCGLENLATIWDDEQHKDDDIAPGTFAEYLRYGSVHWDQTREIQPSKVGANTEEIYKAGILEPINLND